jgi:hypothetical protein
LAAYTEARQVIKDITTYAKKVKDSEMLSKIIDLQSNIIDMHEENQELKDQIRDVRDQLAKVSENLIDRERLAKFHDMFVDEDKLKYIETSPKPYTDALLEHMYCPRCLQKDEKLISMGKNDDYGNEVYGLICPVCGFSTWFGNNPNLGSVSTF